eukprot:2280239-Rhodomonas_salina.1
MHTEDQDRAERLKRLQSAMSTDAKVASKAKSSVMGGLQTEKISLNSRKLNEVCAGISRLISERSRPGLQPAVVLAANSRVPAPVSYTHLTLPTICSV